MTSPGYVPKYFARSQYRHLFGKSPAIVWDERVEASEAIRLQASRLQHAYACVIRVRARGKFGSIKAYAESLGVDPQRLQRVLRGDVPMRLEDIGAAALTLGESVHATAQDVLMARVTLEKPD